MTRDGVTARHARRLIAARFSPGAISDVADGVVTADVPPQRWIEALTLARGELGCDVFDWLSAVDELADGFAIVAHVHSAAEHWHLLLRTRVAASAPGLPTATPVYGGAAGDEREAARLFGIRFAGHPDPPPLVQAVNLQPGERSP